MTWVALVINRVLVTMTWVLQTMTHVYLGATLVLLDIFWTRELKSTKFKLCLIEHQAMYQVQSKQNLYSFDVTNNLSLTLASSRVSLGLSLDLIMFLVTLVPLGS